MIDITRFHTTAVVTAGSSAATTSQRFPFSTMAGAAVVIANTGGATQINWHGALEQESAPIQVYSDGAAVTTAVTVGIHPVPDACFSLPFVVPVLVGGTTCAMTVSLKG
jgi:hypothetical protein